MRVFVTGGTGIIGSHVVAELIGHGHTVVALARSDSSAHTVTSAGATALRGALSDIDVLRRGTDDADGVIHLAFSPDFRDADALRRAIDEETRALDTVAELLDGTDRPVVVASGTPWVVGRASTETDALSTEGPVAARARAVIALLRMATRGVRASAVRIPRTAHDRGEGGFAGVLTDIARRSGVAGYPGDGTQRWPAVHARDAAALFRLALEHAPGGTSWHAVAEEGLRVRDVASVIGRRLGLPVEPVAQDRFGPLGAIFAMDQPASSVYTREVLGWKPAHPGLLADLEHLRP